MLRISLAAARTNANMSQTTAGRLMGVSRATIANWERGKVIPNKAEQFLLSEIYGIDKKHIFFGSESTKSRI